MIRHLATLLFFLVLATAARAGDDPLAPLGSNLGGITDFSDEFPFVNLMKSSRDWIPGRAGCFDCRDNPSCGGTCPVTLDLDTNGDVQSLLPNQEARTVIYAGAGLASGRLPAGTYTMLFDGSGSVNFFGASNVQNPQPGRITFDIGASNTNIGFNLTATTPGNPLRNIRILPPGGAEFMLALGRRLPLAEALDIALSNAPGFDPQSGFGVLVNAGAVTEVIVEETTA